MTFWQPELLTERLDRPPCRMTAESGTPAPGQTHLAGMAVNPHSP